MKNLQEATERICELKGSLLALDALTTALLRRLPGEQRQALQAPFQSHAEVARTVLLHAPVSDHTIDAFDRDVRRLTRLLVDDA
jgi:hypothetical protein